MRVIRFDREADEREERGRLLEDINFFALQRRQALAERLVRRTARFYCAVLRADVGEALVVAHANVQESER